MKDSLRSAYEHYKCNQPLIDLLRRVGARGKTLVFANGCFDLLHAGHIRLLNAVKAAAWINDPFLVVGLNSDASVERLKGGTRPLMPWSVRAYSLLSLRAVDLVVGFDEDTPEQLIKTIRPAVLFKGHDQAYIPGGDFVVACGGVIAYVETVEGLSTTLITENKVDLDYEQLHDITKPFIQERG